MIVYLDTSALLKLYLEEAHATGLRKVIHTAALVCTHLITYAEMCAGLAQAVRMDRITESDRVSQMTRFEADWRAAQVVLVDEPLVRRAGELAGRFGLRGYDSVHLAAAESVWRQAPAATRFVTFDQRQREAGLVLGMAVPENG